MILPGFGSVALLAVLATPIRAHEHASPTALPAGAEKAVVERLCTNCHGVERVLGSGGTQAGWEDRIRRMNRWGARVPPEEAERIARYLAAALPPRRRAIESAGYTASSAVQEVRVQDVQRTLRFAARMAGLQRAVLVDVPAYDRRNIVSGQRVRLFSPQQRGRFTSAVVSTEASGPALRLASAVDPEQLGTLLIAEIPISMGRHLAVANEAIQVDLDGYSVFVQTATEEYVQRRISLGDSGDLVTQVTAGLHAGEQVVSLGAFFIDAEKKMGVMQ